jgi:hypothetical protein
MPNSLLRKSITKEASMTISRWPGMVEKLPILGTSHFLSFGLVTSWRLISRSLRCFDWFIDKQNNMDITISVLGYW